MHIVGSAPPEFRVDRAVLADQRRTVVALTAPAADLFGQVYDPIREVGLAELAGYSPAEITMVTEVLRRGERMQLAQAERIRSLPQLGSPGTAHDAVTHAVVPPRARPKHAGHPLHTAAETPPARQNGSGCSQGCRISASAGIVRPSCGTARRR